LYGDWIRDLAFARQRQSLPASESLVDSTSSYTEEGYVIWKIDHATLGQLVDQGGIEALTGPTGSVALLHCNIVHGSSDNVSPMSRAVFYLN
jgi:hypothetical protein